MNPALPHGDVVGSLLRPSELLHARNALASGAMSPTEFKRIEDQAVDDAVALQQKAGLHIVTDGEMRRLSFQSALPEAVEGFGKFDINAFLWGADEPVRVPRTTVAPAPTTTTQAPYWMGKYGWDYKEFLDNLTAVRNCTMLHSEYIRAMTGNARITEQFGTGTADLMEYIFKAEDRVGCFG